MRLGPSPIMAGKPATHWLGFFGCWAADRPVFVGAPEGMTFRQINPRRDSTWDQACPGCGVAHKWRPEWRGCFVDEYDERVELVVDFAAAI